MKKTDKILKGQKAERIGIELGLQENVELGLMKIVGKRDRENLYSITEKGKAYVESMPWKYDGEDKKWLKTWDRAYEQCKKDLLPLASEGKGR